jgi:hypothetical protein
LPARATPADAGAMSASRGNPVPDALNPTSRLSFKAFRIRARLTVLFIATSFEEAQASFGTTASPDPSFYVALLIETDFLYADFNGADSYATGFRLAGLGALIAAAWHSIYRTQPIAEQLLALQGAANSRKVY